MDWTRLEQLKSLVQVAILSFAKGKPLASDEKWQQRLDICAGCSKVLTHKKTGALGCQICGCKLHLKAKLEHASCPLKKW